MRKSSLGRRSSLAQAGWKTLELPDRKIPVLSRSTSAYNLQNPLSVPRKRDLSAGRVSSSNYRDASAKTSEYGAGASGRPDTQRTPRTLTVSGGRASSISSKKGDTRPITEKEWQSSAIITVTNALTLDEEGCSIVQISKSLRPMSMSLFVDVCNNLIKKLDPKLEIDRANYLNELPFILKKLLYKGKIDKMMLQTVNTIHTWPHVVGIFHFLSELVLASEDFKACGLTPMYPESIELESSDNDGHNFKYVVPLCLNLWNQSGKDKESNIAELIQKNRDGFQHALRMSGFSDDVFEKEQEIIRKYEEARKKNNEALESLNKVERQKKKVIDKLNAITMKNADCKKENSELNTKYQEMDNISQLENQIKDIEDETEAVERILNQCDHSVQNSMTPEEYVSYKTLKKTLHEDIKFEDRSLFEVHESLSDETLKNFKLKKECEKLFRDYNNTINELLKDDLSVRSALCHTRPRLGVTPCNEATAKLLYKTLQSYKDRIVDMEQQFLQTEDQSAVQFKRTEEIKDKMALLNKLKTTHLDTLKQQEKLKTDLQKQLLELTERNANTDAEVLSTQESLKKDNEEYLEKEEELKVKEARLSKFHNICQRKLEIRHETIVQLNGKLKNLSSKVKAEFITFDNKCSMAVELMNKKLEK